MELQVRLHLVIGWIVAASVNIPNNMNPFDLGSPIPWMLFMLIFSWTPPHFWALALYRSGEYGKVEFHVTRCKRSRTDINGIKVLLHFAILIGSVPCFWPEYGLPLVGPLSLVSLPLVFNIGLENRS